ncbi:MAG: cytochrome P450 [Saprospiraceae bacterium]
MSNNIPTLPPKSPRYRSIIRLQRFIQNPIPFLNENLKEFGDTYCFSLRYSKVNILTIDPDVIQHILRKNADNYEKPDGSTNALARFIGKGLLLATGEEHTRQRALMAPGFRPKQMGKLVSLMDNEIDKYCDELDVRLSKSSTINIAEEMKAMTFRVMSKAIYSDDMNKETIHDFSKRFDTLQDFFIKLVRLPAMMKWYDFNGKTKFYEKVANENNQVLLDIISARRKRELEDDLLGMLMGCKYEDTKEGMTDTQLKEESLILFVAGHETASNILSWIFYLLHEHPECVEKIKAEKENILQGRKPEFTDLMRMEYLTQVIDECLRLYPPSWITDRIAKEDDEVKGFLIPKGSRVIPFIYGLHHSEKVWPDAEKFDPSRFTKEGRKDRHNFAHMPFGAGPRQCIGRHFAMTEMKMIILKLIYRYDFDLIKNQKIEVLPVVTLRPRYGIQFILKHV